MKILLVNKFLFPHGGSETYIFKLNEILKQKGHEVQFFGMNDTKRIVNNNVESYTTNIDFHESNFIKKISYPIKIIYSIEARKKIRKVLDDFSPDVVHLNNFNYQLTPSIILEIVKWRNDNNKKCNIVYTAHDYQLICPNHSLFNFRTNKICEKCIKGNYFNCIKYKCIHNSVIRSFIGTIESYFWKKMKTYKYIDSVICPSYFMMKKLNEYELLKNKTIVLHNFVEQPTHRTVTKKDYVIYFGRYSAEKGINSLVEACNRIPQIKFIFAGQGPLEDKINSTKNINNVGFKSGEELRKLVEEARFSICPSIVFENCPFSVIESQMYGTPVLIADIGGIPELVDKNKTGDTFVSGNVEDLVSKIQIMWEKTKSSNEYSEKCLQKKFVSTEQYYDEIMSIYSK